MKHQALDFAIDHVHGKPDGDATMRTALHALSDDYKVFYEPQRDRREFIDPYDRTLNAVIVHRTKGILAITLKCGEISEEPGGLINQFQARRSYYKVIDPAKQAKLTLQELMRDFDPAWDVAPNFSVAVFLPETSRREFFDPQSIFFFEEDFKNPAFANRLKEMFLDPMPKADLDRLEAGYVGFCNYLKLNSNPLHPFEERQEKLKQLAAATPASSTVHLFKRPTQERLARQTRPPEALQPEPLKEVPPVIETAIQVVEPAPAPVEEPKVEAIRLPQVRVEIVTDEPVAKPTVKPTASMPEMSEPLANAPDMQPLHGRPPRMKTNIVRALPAPKQNVQEAPTLLEFFNKIEDQLHIPRDTRTGANAEQWALAMIVGMALIAACYYGSLKLAALIH